jgi:hypothetical protein
MKLSSAAGFIAVCCTSTASAFTPSSSVSQSLHRHQSATARFAEPPKGGLSFEEEEKVSIRITSSSPSSDATSDDVTNGSVNGNVNGNVKGNVNQSSYTKKLNEIDFCMSPADVSLSRLYQSFSKLQPTPDANSIKASAYTYTAGTGTGTTLGSASFEQNDTNANSSAKRIMSLTRALNNASNRAVRRILLSRSWPSPEALNLSLRQVLAAGAGAGKNEASVTELKATKEKESVSVEESSGESSSSVKCPVPRPILNIIMKESNSNTNPADSSEEMDGQAPEVTSPTPLGRKGSTDEQWVIGQLQTFRETYGHVQGYTNAEAYMESILSLATSGVESERVTEVIEQGVYEDSYRRIISVLKSAGVMFEVVQQDEVEGEVVDGVEALAMAVPKMKISKKLRDQDICLSMLDKINIKNGGTMKVGISVKVIEKVDEPYEIVQEVQAVSTTFVNETIETKAVGKSKEEKQEENFAQKFLLWIANKNGERDLVKKDVRPLPSAEKEEEDSELVEEEEIENIKTEDLGGVLLSKEEPTITRQLNVLSNIVERTLLYGGDQEILVLSKTLEADKPAFIQQWYPETVGSISEDDLQNEKRPGVQYFNCLVQLLENCYDGGIITSLDPPLPLASSFTTAYERLTAKLAELGSGYVRPINSISKVLTKKPKSAKEGLIKFSQWEVALRQTQPDVSDFPVDLVGSWQVKDEIGGKVIGTSTVVFKPEGVLEVSPPLRGLQWRLDPGPTHLDTCTFQVLSEDGAILQYRGFMDRGARLESRFSRRSIKIRGAVSFQMRDSTAALIGEDYKRDLLPLEIPSGTTRFVMSKVFDLN